jgi:tetratricopeptide (TPR) repeat protein
VRSAEAVQEAIARQAPPSTEAALFILDGLECPAVVALLLPRFAHLHFLLTTQSPLLLPEEQALELPPLHVSEARRLLIGWTRMNLDAEEAASVARFLDGNPQAVRLVAALLETEPLTSLRVRLETQLTALTLHGGTATPLTVTRDLLLERFPEGVRRLLGVLSLFATGAQGADLEVSWGRGWQRSMEVLVRAGLVAEDEGRYQLVIALPNAPPQAKLGPTGVLLALALGHLRTGEAEPAFDLAERALAVARESQNREGFACALLVLGRVTLTDDPARAILLFEEAATHFENLRDKQSLSEARHCQGVAFCKLGEPEAALAALYEVQEVRHHPSTEKLFTEVQALLTDRGGGSLLAALALDSAALRETGLLAARVQLGLPGK